MALGGVGQHDGDLHKVVIAEPEEIFRHVDLPLADVLADSDARLLLEDAGQVGGGDADGLGQVSTISVVSVSRASGT